MFARKGAQLSRVVNTESNNTSRKRYLQSVATAIRYASENQIDEQELRDILAFLILALREINELNEKTVSAWEKRGYWVKADRYRIQWAWVNDGLILLDTNLKRNDVQSCMSAAASLAQHLTDINLTKRNRSSKPWLNAWELWNEQIRG